MYKLYILVNMYKRRDKTNLPKIHEHIIKYNYYDCSSGKTVQHGDEVGYTCEEGYTRHHPHLLTCQVLYCRA